MLGLRHWGLGFGVAQNERLFGTYRALPSITAI